MPLIGDLYGAPTKNNTFLSQNRYGEVMHFRNTDDGRTHYSTLLSSNLNFLQNDSRIKEIDSQALLATTSSRNGNVAARIAS